MNDDLPQVHWSAVVTTSHRLKVCLVSPLEVLLHSIYLHPTERCMRNVIIRMISLCFLLGGRNVKIVMSYLTLIIHTVGAGICYAHSSLHIVSFPDPFKKSEKIKLTWNYAKVCQMTTYIMRLWTTMFIYRLIAIPCRNRRLFRRVFRSHRCVQSAVSLNFH